MYICLCKGITDHQLRNALDQSKANPSLKEVCKKLGVGTDCGSCLKDAYSLLKSELEQKSEHRATKQTPKT
jgi:bacterioferritin-associated ferredoxin